MTLEEIYKKAHRKLDSGKTWEWYLVEKYKETRSETDRDALIDFYFTKYQKIYVKIRNKFITKEITQKEYHSQCEQMIYTGFQIGVDLGFARKITEIECENLINGLTNAFDEVDISVGEVTEKVHNQLCVIQVPAFDLFRKYYDKNILK